MSVLKINKRERIKHMLFTLPAILLVTAFIAVPIVYSFVVSLMQFDGINAPRFIWLHNYTDLFTSSQFFQILGNNLEFMVIGIPALTLIPLVLAIILHGEIRGHKFFRFTFFLPAVLSVSIVGVTFRVLFSYMGAANSILGAIGLSGLVQDWLGSGKTSIPIIALAMLWSSFGLNTIIYLAGLAMIPDDVYESCDLDGFSWFQKLIYITVPMIISTFEFIIVLSVINVLSSMFGLIFTLTSGGPGNQSTTLEYLIYIEGFNQNRLGYASTISTVLFVVMLLITVAIRRLFAEKE